MGLRDAFRTLRGAGRADPLEEEASAASEPEPDWFIPRYDGLYDGGADPTAPGANTILRFFPGGRVFEATVDPSSPLPSPGPHEQDPRGGEYTAAGRFTVQRRFERAVVYTVIEVQPDGFTTRRITSADRGTAEHTYLFRPDSPPSDPA